MSVKTYSYKKDGNKKLAEHFIVKEFGSTSGSKIYSDTVKVETDVIKVLEKLFTVKSLGVNTIIITSGYRTSAHDTAVGGSGRGAHVEGKAADFVCRDKNNKIIPAKKVCCALEDFGNVKGIGYIGESAVHIDMNFRSAKWWGDETRPGQLNIWNYKPGCKSWYDYFGIKKPAVTATVKKTEAAPKVTYFKKYTGTTVSIVNALDAIGAKSDYAYREKIAVKNGISGYTGTAGQNTQMLNLLKKGKLIKP